MKKALVVVDMQHDFIDGALGSEEARAIVERVERKIIQCEGEGAAVLLTQDTHGEDYASTQEGRNLPVPHCIRGTEGWKILSSLHPEGRRIFEKGSFGSTSLAEFLCTQQPEEVELVGLCTDICVISNALLIKAFLPETKIVVDASCCAGVTPQSHRTALEAMKACQISVING